MPTPPDLAAPLGSWELKLGAERKCPRTVKAYGDSVRAQPHLCAANGRLAAIRAPRVYDERDTAAHACLIGGALTAGFRLSRAGFSPSPSP